MSEGPKLSERQTAAGLNDWGHLLESVLAGACFPHRLCDLLRDSLSDQRRFQELREHFGPGGPAHQFVQWWSDAGVISTPEDELSALQAVVETAFGQLFQSWTVERDRLFTPEGIEVAVAPEVWSRIWPHLTRPKEDLANSLDHAIARVRSFFEPLESPLFGMNTELLDHHVKETIPREVPGENVSSIVPLFGKHQRRHGFTNSASLPAHLRVVLRRLERSQAENDIVGGLLATLEATDYTLRFATGLAQGCWAAVTESEIPGPFAPTTAQLIGDLAKVTRKLRSYWDHPHAQPALHLLFRGKDLNPFLEWAGLESQPRLLSWMMEAETAIREDNPARCSALSEEIGETFAIWMAEFTLLCSAWDIVSFTRQDGYLGTNVARGPLSVICKPLIDPTRYSVWLDRSELTTVSDSRRTEEASSGRLPRLDSRIMLCSNDPPLLSDFISELLKAHEENQLLSLGRGLFRGLEYLVRLHASLAGGYLRHQFAESSPLDPVLRPGGSLGHTILFLSYAHRILGEIDHPEAKLLRAVFFQNDRPRRVTRWLGVDGVPGPLQGLIGWSLSLARPDAANRADEILEQIPRFFQLFAEFLEASRQLWSSARLQIETGFEGSQVTVCQFPSGLRIRGVPDVVVGHRIEQGTTGVVVGGALDSDPFSDWETPTDSAPSDQEGNSLIEESPWPSFFEDNQGPVRAPWPTELAQELAQRCLDRTFAGPEGRPIELAREIASFIKSAPSGASTISLIRGQAGSGRTLLCRTLAHANYSPLPPDLPVLYLKVDRFPETRLSTVVERLNDHIRSESSLERFNWIPVPAETLQSMGWEVERLSKDLADLGQFSAPLACRLSSYLRYLKKLNDGRDFVLLLDGFEMVPASLVPKVLSPGIHLVVTGSEFADRGESTTYLTAQMWDLSQESTSRAAFSAQLGNTGLDANQRRILFQRFGGSLLKARAFADLVENHDNYHPSSNVLDDVLAWSRQIFPDNARRQSLVELLTILGLYERPVPLRILESLGIDPEVANVATNELPSLFSFWNEPEPALGLSHRSVFSLLLDSSGQVEIIAERLTRDFLASPKRGELLPALRWLSQASGGSELIEQVFGNSEVAHLWREELARLWKQGLYFQRVALLDATESSLREAIETGTGHLREDLGWLHNARGLTLLKLGLLEEAAVDLEIALEHFQAQFAGGEVAMVSSIGSALNRLSELAMKRQNLGRADRLSDAALTILAEGRDIAESDKLRGLTAIALLQRIQLRLRDGDPAAALSAADQAGSLLRDLDRTDEPVALSAVEGELGWYRAEALAGLGRVKEAIAELTASSELLLRSGTLENGIQALLLRARLQSKTGDPGAAYLDLERVVSILRYRVFTGRLDLEPLLAYTAARRALTSVGVPEEEARALDEFVEWARHGIRHEGRGDLRALLAYLLLSRGRCWKDARAFARAVDDLREATEQYELLEQELSRTDSPPLWNGLTAAFRQLTSLYISLDEPALAVLAGRRALELSEKTTTPDPESGLEVPAFSLIATSRSNVSEPEDPFEGELYQSARLYFHLGEATRRLNLERFATAYFEQAALGYEKLFAGLDSPPGERLEEYRAVLKFVAKSAETRRDFDSLAYWAAKLSALPERILSDFDRFSIHSWLGGSQAACGRAEGALAEYRKALEVLDRLSGHPRLSSLRAERLMDAGRVLSLRGLHQAAFENLESALELAQNALFEEEEEGRELLIRGALHQAVAHLRAGQRDEALDRLRILESHRPLGSISELGLLTEDWVTAWQESEELSLEELARRLAQVCELGDWLLRTPLGLWFRELVTELVTHHDFTELQWQSERLNQIIETFLIVSFSQASGENSNSGLRGASVSDTGELQRLLKAKYQCLEAEGRLVEAELVLSHMLPTRATPASGRLLLLRSEMALNRGDRGVGIVDLLRATETRGKAKVRAHLRLAEFLLSRDLHAAASTHLRRSLFSIEEAYEDLTELLDRVGSLMTGLVRAGGNLEPNLLEEYLRVAGGEGQPFPYLLLDLGWLRSLGDYRDWPSMMERTLTLVAHRCQLHVDTENDWRFLEEVLERTLLCSGSLSPVALKELGQLLVLAGLRASDATGAVRELVWQRFIGLLPSLGRRDGSALLRRLFAHASGKGVASATGRAAEFLARLDEEIRVLSQPG